MKLFYLRVQKDGQYYCHQTCIFELNKSLDILNDEDLTNESTLASNGRALKIYTATENLTYGCWREGLYIVKGYLLGAPNNWGGSCLVVHLRNSDNSLGGYVKTMFSADCNVYEMRQDPDGTVTQNWK